MKLQKNENRNLEFNCIVNIKSSRELPVGAFLISTGKILTSKSQNSWYPCPLRLVIQRISCDRKQNVPMTINAEPRS